VRFVLSPRIDILRIPSRPRTALTVRLSSSPIILTLFSGFSPELPFFFSGQGCLVYCQYQPSDIDAKHASERMS
jgi:hypothetical protein